MEITNLSISHTAMPDFVGGTAAFAHTVDSALHVLDALGISESRLTLRMAGGGRTHLEIVRQSPPPGTPLTPSTPLTLWIAGFGFFDALPQPMRESGGEAELGTREFCPLFDDPLQKAAYWARAGSLLFRIGADKPVACRRWIALFGIDSSVWPEELLYPLALLAPTLASTAGREVGIRLAFLVLLGLPIAAFHFHRAYRLLPKEEHSHLGSAASRIGRDFLAGDRQLDTDSIAIQFGPVPLETYMKFQSAHGSRLMEMVSDVCASAYQNHTFSWQVGDANETPHLGIAAMNSCIGLNFYLGRRKSA